MSDLIASVKNVSADDLRRWRQGSTTIGRSAPGGVPTDDPVEFDAPRPVRPLDARDTWDSMLALLWKNQREDRDSYAKAVQWIRAKNPNAVGYMTDEQLRDYLDMRCREAVQRVMRQKNRVRAYSVDGVW